MRRRIRRGVFWGPGLLVVLGTGIMATGALLREEATARATPSSEDCFRIRASKKKRRKCFEALGEARLQRARQELSGLEASASPLQRDRIRIRIAAEAPRLAGTLCLEVETDEGARLCGRIADRPHLYATSSEWVMKQKARESEQGEAQQGRGTRGRITPPKSRKNEGAPRAERPSGKRSER